MGVEEIGRKENYQKFERRVCGIFILPFVLVAPAACWTLFCSVCCLITKTTTSNLTTKVLCYFLPLKTSNIIFPSHMEEMEKQMNKGKVWVKGILFLSLVSEWLCNICWWSVGFLDDRCSRHHVFLAKLAQVIRFGALRFLFTLFSCNTYSWLNACAVLWNLLYWYEKEISYRTATDWFSKWTPGFSLELYFTRWMLIYQHQVTSLHAVFPTSSQA